MLWSENNFEVLVSDDGQGFETSLLDGGLTDNSCFGLFNIRERLSYIGGSLKIESSPGHGTEVSVVAPYQTGEVGSDD